MLQVRQLKDKNYKKRCQSLVDDIQCNNRISDTDYYLMISGQETGDRSHTWLCAKCGLKRVQTLLNKVGLMWSKLNDTVQKERTNASEVKTIYSEQGCISDSSNNLEDTGQSIGTYINKLLDN